MLELIGFEVLGATFSFLMVLLCAVVLKIVIKYARKYIDFKFELKKRLR